MIKEDGSSLDVPVMGEGSVYNNEAYDIWIDIQDLQPGKYRLKVTAGNDIVDESTLFDKIPSPPSVTADDFNNVLIGADSTMEYTLDYPYGDSVEWKAYDESNPPVFEGEQLVYIRYKETEFVPASYHTQVTFNVDPIQIVDGVAFNLSADSQNVIIYVQAATDQLTNFRHYQVFTSDVPFNGSENGLEPSNSTEIFDNHYLLPVSEKDQYIQIVFYDYWSVPIGYYEGQIVVPGSDPVEPTGNLEEAQAAVDALFGKMGYINPAITIADIDAARDLVVALPVTMYERSELKLMVNSAYEQIDEAVKSAIIAVTSLYTEEGKVLPDITKEQLIEVEKLITTLQDTLEIQKRLKADYDIVFYSYEAKLAVIEVNELFGIDAGTGAEILAPGVSQEDINYALTRVNHLSEGNPFKAALNERIQYAQQLFNAQVSTNIVNNLDNQDGIATVGTEYNFETLVTEPVSDEKEEVTMTDTITIGADSIDGEDLFLIG